jgi:hypothetical protein
MYYWIVHRPVWFRALISIWGLWLSAALSEAPGLHACPVHGGHGAHAAQTAALEHSGHMGHMAHGSQPSAPTDQSHHDPAGCTCLGLCCCAATVATPASSIELADAIVVDTPQVRHADVTSPVVQRAYSLPFANGPPTA